MHSIGADIHEESIRCHVVDPARRKLAAQTLLCSHPAVAGARFRPFQLVVEATAGYEWFVQLVEPLDERVVSADSDGRVGHGSLRLASALARVLLLHGADVVRGIGLTNDASRISPTEYPSGS